YKAGARCAYRTVGQIYIGAVLQLDAGRLLASGGQVASADMKLGNFTIAPGFFRRHNSHGGSLALYIHRAVVQNNLAAILRHHSMAAPASCADSGILYRDFTTFSVCLDSHGVVAGCRHSGIVHFNLRGRNMPVSTMLAAPVLLLGEHRYGARPGRADLRSFDLYVSTCGQGAHAFITKGC